MFVELRDKVESVHTASYRGKVRRRGKTEGRQGGLEEGLRQVESGNEGSGVRRDGIADRSLLGGQKIMAIKTYRPYTKTRRYQTGLGFEELTTSKPHKALLEPKDRISGRNNRGRITIRHRGGGHKRHYRVIDFKRDKVGIAARVATRRIRPEPLGVYFASALCGRGEALHPLSARAEGWG